MGELIVKNKQRRTNTPFQKFGITPSKNHLYDINKLNEEDVSLLIMIKSNSNTKDGSCLMEPRELLLS